MNWLTRGHAVPHSRSRSARTKTVRTSTAAALAAALAAGTLAAVTVVSTTTPAAAAPGNPGTPSAPVVLYTEDFENTSNNSNVLLTNYVGANGTTYTGSPFWTSRSACNGFIIDHGSPRVAGDCNGPTSTEAQGAGFYDNLTAVPRALGLNAGLSSAQANLNGAAASYTSGGTSDNEIQFETENPITLPAANRFVTFSVDAGAENCFATHPELRFYLKNAAGAEIPVSTSAIDPCTDSRARNFNSTTQDGRPFVVSAGTFAANSSRLLTGNTLGIVMRNENGGGGGNDGAYDNIRVLDVTPQLDKSFSPARVPVNGKSTLTLTVTNTSELAAKSGWGFTDALPDGLTIASPNGVGGTCDANTVATPGTSDIEITGGNLAAGERSCTITVDVTSTTPGPTDASPKTYQNCAANIEDVVGMNLPNCASVEFYSTAKLKIDKTSTATSATRVGDTVTYTVKATNVGDADFTNAKPGVVRDDLTGVLDDADYNEDATADKGGTPSYASPTITWSGPLKVDETVTITYTVKLKAGGDGTVDNLAFESCQVSDPNCDPSPPDPADCVDGVDPATGKGCDPSTFLLPKLTIEKSSDTTELPTNGGTVHYTVTATNDGPGAYTAAEPARVIDDLTDVIDDGTLDESTITTDRGTTPTYSSPRITWTGALTSGQSVTIEYDVTYAASKGGNNDLANVAFGTDDPTGPVPTPTCDPAVNGVDPDTGLPCDRVSVPGADLEVTKSVNPTSGSTVVAGDTLTYTLTFDNDGKAGADVDYTDYLAGVLDDADVTVQPATGAGSGLTVTPVANGSFDVDGTVAAGTTQTVIYTVKVKADGSRGDSKLGNFLVEGATPPPPPGTPCAAGDPLCTTNPVSQVEDAKSVDPKPGTTVQPGQVLTYTLTFKNVAQGDGVVTKDDDLTHVLDDADVIEQPTSSNSSIKVSALNNKRYSITGTVGAGETITVTYQVRVKAAKNLGDKQLGNFLLKPSDPTPSDPTACAEGSTDCTYNPVGDIVAEKSVSPKNFSTVEGGDTLTYTLTFTNTGKGTSPIDYTDRMGGVLDDADLVKDPIASDAGVTTTLKDAKLRVTGELAPGQKVTVTYAVEVKDYDDQGDHNLLNFLVVTGDTPPKSCKPVSGPAAAAVSAQALSDTGLCTSNTVEKADGGGGGFLPSTGAPYGRWMAPLGAMLLVVGAGLAVTARRRRSEDELVTDSTLGLL